MADINDYMGEMQQKWILGEADVDATWDQYIETINSYDYGRAQELYTTAHKRATGK